MSGPIIIQLTFTGFEKTLITKTATQMQAVLTQEILLATRKSAADIVNAIRMEIRNGRFRKNAPLTKLIKGSSKPLIETQALQRFIDVEINNAFLTTVGYFKRDRTLKRGGSLFEVLNILENGATYKFTSIQKAFIRTLLINVGLEPPIGGKVKDSLIRIPPRPFFTRAVRKKGLRKKIEQNYRIAIRRGFAKLGLKAI